MARHLQETLGEFTFVGPLQIISQPFRQKHLLYSKAFNENYLCEFEPLLNRCLSLDVERRLRDLGRVDAIIAPGCFPCPIALLNTDIPIIFWADATFAGLLKISPHHQNICSENVWCGEELQSQMLNRASLAVYASQWSADSACHDYGIDRDKVGVLPYGANLHFTIESEDVLEQILIKRNTESCRLLFVARSWHQRSGNFTLQVLRALKNSGLKATLVIAGCERTPELNQIEASEEFEIEIYPTIDKDAAAKEQAYVELLSTSHFMLHPSRTTCFGIGICEASAWGLPVLAHNSGGVSSVLTDGINGALFSCDGDPELEAAEYASTIISLYKNPQRYRQLCRTAWKEYKSRLNWRSSVTSLVKLIEKRV